ncbi:MAG: glycosyltransferase family 2 protein [Prevotella sp.]|nr:glycosyltransferase family 2 protein [Prevotella sp.]
MKALSILIPTYNDLCVNLVDALRQQAEEAALAYEILVADDGSTDAEVIARNSEINQWDHCQYLRQAQNIGRAAIRNFLAQQAQYDHLLFIDSDMSMVRTDYLANYLAISSAEVVDGGVCIGGDPEALKHNLRYRYEKAVEHEHTVEIRQQNPYRDFHTANFLIPRDLMLTHPFDERFHHYGYEDVLFGKQLRADRIAITHIDNPMGFCTFESNPDFVAKTEEGLQTLCQFRNELRGYSRMLTFVDGIHIPLIVSLIRLIHRLFGSIIRRNLCGHHPFLPLFSFYKLGYFLILPESSK